jgi:hypothetical protein
MGVMIMDRAQWIAIFIILLMAISSVAYVIAFI